MLKKYCCFFGRNVFRFSGGLQGWNVTYPPQWKQQDSVNCGVFMCSVSCLFCVLLVFLSSASDICGFIKVNCFVPNQAAENEVQHVAVSTEALTLNQCRTLRLHHATQMIKNVNAEVGVIDVLLCDNIQYIVKKKRALVRAKFFVTQDFPLTAEDKLTMEEKESKLKTDSSSHCQASKTKLCLFQRATGTTKYVLHK